MPVQELIVQPVLELAFQSLKGGCKLTYNTPVKIAGAIFQSLKGGCKLDEKLDFIISILCTSVNVFILIHPLKINTN
ncbi:hypothetical protein [Caldicellulosiruptor bescii]|uniref:hypothetical protein n=1 Tax=Caldicellulosiruptor bescii TaxID=31899 RepID=UPI0015C677D2|nr:hypothetical protein [Caldicellulosiruptor bescii]